MDRTKARTCPRAPEGAVAFRASTPSISDMSLHSCGSHRTSRFGCRPDRAGLEKQTRRSKDQGAQDLLSQSDDPFEDYSIVQCTLASTQPGGNSRSTLEVLPSWSRMVKILRWSSSNAKKRHQQSRSSLIQRFQRLR